MNSRDNDKAEQLASEGLALSKTLRDDNKIFVDELSNSYFSIAAALFISIVLYIYMEEMIFSQCI